MEKYLIQQGDTYQSLANKLNISDPNTIMQYHNLNCEQQDMIGHELPQNKFINIPAPPQVAQYNNATSEKAQKKESQKQEKQEKEATKSEHEGKLFVIQKGTAKCNQGDKFPQFKVTSHTQHYWNDKDGKPDYLAVTESDLMFNPPGPSFGQCKLKPTSGGYLPCSFTPAGKWTKTYEKVKVMGHACVTQCSKLQCGVGGMIEIKDHGQKGEAAKSNFKRADPAPVTAINPTVNMKKFQEEQDDNSFFN
jgi:hypothetical protein